MTDRRTFRVEEVYGVGRDIPQNYVERASVDEPFVNNLSRDKHVVVFGSSKQGKTSLRKHALPDGDCITVCCLNTMSLPDLNSAVLKAAGYELTQSTKISVSGASKVVAGFKGEGKVPFFVSAGGEASVEKENGETKEVDLAPLELEIGDVNDIITALESIEFKKFIVLEDFHYLPVETQRNFCFALKTFHERSKISFIIIGVWRDKGRLEYYNGDLTGRVLSIDADAWSRDELLQVIRKGGDLLNIEFPPDFADELVNHSHDSVHIVQEACLRACQQCSIKETQSEKRVVDIDVPCIGLIEQIVAGQAGRYRAFLTSFAEGFQKTELAMYRWLIEAVLRTDVSGLEKGVRRSDVSAKIKELHPQGSQLNEGNITQALQNAASLQIQKLVRPIVIDYDETTRVLHVVDKSFLIWLSHQNVDKIVEECLP